MAGLRAPSKTRVIVAITPNPALDLGGTVDRLMPDEKNYVHEETRLPGGNGINAARIVHRLGCPVELSGFLGGEVGNELKGLMDREGLNCRFVRIKGSTRISVTVSDLNSHHQTRLSFSGPIISKNETQELLAYVKAIPSNSLVIFGGSLPSGTPTKLLLRMFQVLSKRGSHCVVDVPSAVLKDVYRAKSPPLLIKPNLIEFQESLGINVSSLKGVIASAQALLSKIPLICVSSVKGGAVLITPHGTWFGRTPPLNVKSTVGAGDSMVGAMCTLINQWSFGTKNDPAFSSKVEDQGGTLLRWGLAAACATLSVAGTELGRKKEINKFLNQIRIDSI